MDDIRDFLGVDTLHFLTLEGMLSCVSQPQENYCTACFSGKYRLNVTQPVSKLDLEPYQLKMFS